MKIVRNIEDEKEVKITLEEIYFIEQTRKGFVVNGEVYPICTVKSLEELESLFNWGFCRCHKEYIVNLAYVKEIEEYNFVLTNGQKIPIAKNMYKNVQKELLEYIK
ncbi:MAG: LytTR family transcriptional regulator [Lachnospiraceae bacterium]|nr:LytTR family transcriptional regulator [Lachnospiraceae bacterium]